MNIKFNDLLIQCHTYIVENKITNNYDFNLSMYPIVSCGNLIRFETFLNEYEGKYKNITWIYFKGLYYYLMNNENAMIELLSGINESNILNLLGYYYLMRNNYNLSKKYYMIAIELNNSTSMQHLGSYYKSIDKNYYLMKKYYQMAIELDNHHAMCNLASYYRDNNNYDLMKKYYEMAIKFNNTEAMIRMAIYYTNREINNDLAKKYYTAAYIHGHPKAKIYLNNYCRTVDGNIENFYKYIYYPNILSIIISLRRKDKKNKNENIFLPDEIYMLIYDEFIAKKEILY